MIQISERNYESLLEPRSAMGAALQRPADVSDAIALKGDDVVPEHFRDLAGKDLAEAVGVARSLLARYGEHQAFIVI